MNSNYGKPNNNSNNNFDFDLGLGSTRSTSLNAQRQPTSQSKPAISSWQPNKPTWTHQPAPVQTNRVGSLNGPTSMVGDISGKSWNYSSTTTASAPSSIGIVGKNPNLFADLVGPALGQGKSSSNAPLKSATPPVPVRSAYSMGNLGDSLPKTNSSVKSASSSEGFGSFGSGHSGNHKSVNLGGPSMRNVGGVGLGSNKDPFGSLVDDIKSKPSGTRANAASKTSGKTDAKEDDFGGFQNSSKPSTNVFQTNVFASADNDFIGSIPKMDNFGIPDMAYGSQNVQAPVHTPSVDPLDMLFSSSSTSTGFEKVGTQQFSEVDDWGMESEFGGGDGGGATTTELEGLPPPPAGVTASSAKNKGMDNYKQGQFADAIKWLSWAAVILEKAGNDDASVEVLSSRASCYKEVGEYKKAVADCTKVLERDGENVSVLVQRALLYESIEKYKLGAEDLRTVLKIDPSNRVARSTVHRLNKMAE